MGIFEGDIEKGEYELIKEGEYEAIISDVVCETSKAGNDYIKLAFRLASNRLVFDNIVWSTEKALNVAKGKLEALGFTRDERKELPDDGGALQVAIFDKVKDNKYMINVGIKEAEGEYKAKNIVKGIKVMTAEDISL